MASGAAPLKIWVTGGAGFLGQHFVRLFAAQGHEVFHEHIDLSDREALNRAAASRKWDVVLHLAGIGSVADCDKDPVAARTVNVEGTRHVAEALRTHCPTATMVFASTAQVYQGAEGAELQAGVTFDESRKIAPQNLYAQTKWEAEQALRDVASPGGSPKVIVLRFFNYTHKSQPPVAFVPHLYSVLAQGATEVPVGNLHVERDIGALPDLLSAVSSVIAHRDRIPALDPVNVCSGVPKLLSDLASRLAMRMKSDAKFVVDPKRVRPNEALRIAGSHAKLTKLTGWTPRFRTIDELVEAFLAEDPVALSAEVTSSPLSQTELGNFGIIIPSYREAAGIAGLLKDIRVYCPDAPIALMDDTPDDSTVKAAESAGIRNLHIVHRTVKGGRGAAVIDGMKKLLALGCDTVLEMDADFSHPPGQIPALVRELKDRKLDMLIASRYIQGSAIVNWPVSRRIFSAASNRLARFMLGIPVRDYTNGFRVYTRPAAQLVTETCGRLGKGFIPLSEILVNLYYRGYRIGETPTRFVNRVRGESSLNVTEIRNAVIGLYRISFLARQLKGSHPHVRLAKCD